MNDAVITPVSGGTRARKPTGVARVRQPIKDSGSGLWRARYVDLDGIVRQAGRCKRKGDALTATVELVAGLNETGRDQASAPTLPGFLEREWPAQFPRHPRTHATAVERIKHYILPRLPEAGEIPLDQLTRAHLRVRPGDPRLNPKRGPVDRRAVPPQEIHAFIAALPERHRGVCWAPVLTGCRPGELFAMHASRIDRQAEMIYVHQTIDRYGRLMNGLKGTHHIAEEEKRGRWTLFPRVLIELLGERAGPGTAWLFPSPRGKHWAIRNFYRNVWTPAQRDAGVAFTLYDLRHTFASRLLAAGIPLVEISAWMGHSLRAGGQEFTNTTTRVYAHATGEWRQRAFKVLTELFSRDA